MAVLARFLVYNLLFSLAAGLLAWLVVFLALRLLNVRSSGFSFYFYSLPVLKSILILLGVGLLAPWPDAWWQHWHSLALPFWQVLPVLILWAAGISILYQLVIRHARRMTLIAAVPADEAFPKLAAAYEIALDGFRKIPCPQCSDDMCCSIEPSSQPRLLVSERTNSPLALTSGGAALILFPAGLVQWLDQSELANALGHELAHFHVRRPSWCSAGMLNRLASISPVAGLLGEFLHRQEEKACDELAVAILGQPEVYACMLTKSFRYAREQGRQAPFNSLTLLPRLVGFKPLLSERIEHILDVSASPKKSSTPLLIWLVWMLLVSILFFTISIPAA